MRIKLKYLFFCFINLLPVTSLLSTCSDQKKGVDNGLLPKSKLQDQDTLTTSQVNLLDGVWWLTPNDIHALFYVEGDSLYYTEEQTSPYWIRLRNDTLVMSRDGVVFSFRVRKLSQDSLVMYDHTLREVIKLYKPIR